MKDFLRVSLIIFLFCILIFTGLSNAQWSGNTQIGTPICTTNDDQNTPVIESDELGGAIIAWIDHRDNVNDAIYAQRINPQGVTLWQSNGVPVCNFLGIKQAIKIVADGNGGAIMVWHDQRGNGGDIYAQKIDKDGLVQWAIDGVAICSVPGYQYRPSIITDGSGGAIISWEDKRDFNNYGIYIQKISADGLPMWNENGKIVSYIPSIDCVTSNIISDNNGGAFVSWADNRNGTFNDDIYLQHVSSSGEMLLTLNGETVIDAPSGQQYPEMLLDNSGGIILIWTDTRSIVSSDIYAQKLNVDSAGFYWIPEGMPVALSSQNDDWSKVVTDGQNGAIITWQRNTSSGNDIFAQRINTDGETQWTVDGIVICNAISDQLTPSIVSDGDGGAIIIWMDFRAMAWDIYAQKVDNNGTIQWDENGVIISDAYGFQTDAHLVSDNEGGAVIVWYDQRSGGPGDIYAERILGSGILTNLEENPLVINQYLLSQNYPNPFNPNTKIKYHIQELSLVTLTVYDVLGNEIETLVNEEKSADTYEIQWNAINLPSGIYFYRLQAGNFVETKKMVLMK